MIERDQPANTEQAGMSPAEAFAILGDRTRLSIIRVLWMADRFHTYEDIDDSASTMRSSSRRSRH